MGAWSTSTTLSTCDTPVMVRCRPGRVLARWTCLASERSRMSLTRVDFPDPDTPVTATSRPRGNSASTSWRLCSRAPFTTRDSPLPRRRTAGTGIDLAPERYWPVSESGLDSRPPGPVTGPGVDDPPPVLPGPGPDVDHVVGHPDGLLVVLHHDHRVAQVAQALEGADEALVVPLVESDRRLVEHVEHPDQAAADLAGQPDPLGLAARQGGGRPGQGQVVEAHVEQELHPLPHLAEDPVGDEMVAVGEVERRHHVDGLPDGQRAQLEDVVAPDGHGQRLGPQPGTAARRAGHLAQVALEVVPQEVGVGLGVAPL